MNTPASSSAASTGSDATSSPGPDTPKREYQFHATVRKTYGRAKPAIEQRSSSPDPWSSQLSFSPSNSNGNSPAHQRRSRLSGSFGELTASSSEAWMTPTRGTRKLIDELKRAKLDLDNSSSSGADNDEEDGEDKGDLENIFKVRKHSNFATTPSRKRPQPDDEEGMDLHDANKTHGGEDGMTGSDMTSQQRAPSRQRKRQILDLDNSSPSRRSPRSAQGRDKLERLGSRSSSSNDMSLPRSASPSPPASPTRRSTRTSVVFPSLPTSSDTVSKALSSPSRTTNSNSKSETKKPGEQVTISSFFAPKAGKGTGILKAKSGSANVNNQKSASSSNISSITDSETRDQQAATKRTTSGPSISQEPPKKLEQLFLAFSKDRTKSNIATTSASSKQRLPVTPTRRPNQLAREDEKLKRYHCPQCGMPYVRGQPEDEQIHDRYHRAVLGGIDYPGYKNEVVVARFRDLEVEVNGASAGRSGGVKGDSVSSSSSSSALWGDASSSRIVMVSMSDSGRTNASVSTSGSNYEKKKVKEVLEVVNKELGSVDFDPEKLDSCKVFLYISGKKKVVGCLIAERIKEGFEIMTLRAEPRRSSVESRASSNTSMDSSSPSSSDAKPIEKRGAPMQLLDDQDRSREGEGGAAIFCSKVPQPAICGINRIWVSSQHRRQKIASRMLDAVRERFIYACQLETKDLAFSQPTGDGKALARQYLGTDRFLVYVE
ncbi:N-acetyltransferase esco2 [Linnemannia exigua]|uniref:N-acetyltransferase esco2 n=1 Tax=Linnemannia exigua TaxID=604196 RepID=A0AAD4D4V9_9FUNG|nr:N-acetyltransferase esco2 [Linnemannia exigua]